MVDEKLVKELNEASGLEAVQKLLHNRAPTPEDMSRLTEVALQRVLSVLTNRAIKQHEAGETKKKAMTLELVDAAHEIFREKLNVPREVKKKLPVGLPTKVDTEAFSGQAPELSAKAIAKQLEKTGQDVRKKGTGLSGP
ncbi:hypothetical protein ACOPJQ_08790 [Luteimonas dalianensis]|uniref:hypothetical protein n=1 Tax=Luteimonas dalianensis TaxID=1148196 RepID=UPI003BF2D7C1